MHDPARPDALNSHRNSFNAIRLLAALQVLFMHATAHLDLSRGAVFDVASQFPGVPVFFATSGFLVFDSRLRSSAVSYTHSRALRIYPALVANIVVLEFLFWLGGGIALGSIALTQFGLYEFVYMLTASEHIAAVFVGGPERSVEGFFPAYPSQVLWTLTVELSFYAFLLVCGPIFKHRASGTGALVLVSAASIVFLFTFGGKNQTALETLMFLTAVPYIWMFAIGMLARLWVHNIPTGWRAAVLTLALYVAASAWFRFDWLNWKLQATPTDLLRTAALCLVVIVVGASPILKSRILRKVDISYGIYLWHMLFIMTLVALGFGGNHWLLLPVLVASTAAAWLSWRYIEEPARSLKGAVTRQWELRPTADSKPQA